MADTEAKTATTLVSDEVVSFGTHTKPEVKTAETDPSAGDTPTEKTIDESKIPTRLRGKTPEQVHELWKNIESELGRKNNELGQLRYTMDTMLRLRDEPTKSKIKDKADPVTTDKLLNDTDATLTNVASRVSKDAVEPIAEQVALLNYKLERAQFEKQFPNYEATMADEKFLGWVGASPYRKSLAQQALNGSFAAAAELFGIHAEVESALNAATDTKATTRQTDPTEGSTVKPGAGGAKTTQVRKNVSTQGKPLLKRGELMMLQIKNPEEYRRRFDEIKEAYREGRVK